MARCIRSVFTPWITTQSCGRSESTWWMRSTKAILDSETISGFHGGEYLTWNLTGNVEFHITKLAGPNAVISGLFCAARHSDDIPGCQRRE